MNPSSTQAIPSPSALPVLGHSHHFIGKSPVAVAMEMTKLFDGIFNLKFFGMDIILITGQKYAHAACSEGSFEKSIHLGLQELRAIGGDGLFTAYDHEANWRKAHNILLPGFSKKAMSKYLPIMHENAKGLCDRLARHSGSFVKADDEMARYTLETVAACGFGYSFEAFADEKSDAYHYLEAMNYCLTEGLRRMKMPGFLKALPLPSLLRFKRNTQKMFRYADDIITKRMADQSRSEELDFLNLMLNTLDKDTGEKLDKENIRYQLLTFLVAGHETTSSVLAFAIYFLLRHPEVLVKARAEVDRVWSDGVPSGVSMKEVLSFRYLQQIFRECLRLWPTAPSIAVQSPKGAVLCDRLYIKPNQVCILSLPNLHRDKSVWGENSDAFDPENFSAENMKNIPENAYMPFGQGARTCIGQHFAMTEAIVLLAMMLKRFDFEGKEDYQLEVSDNLTIKPENLWVRFKPRF